MACVRNAANFTTEVNTGDTPREAGKHRGGFAKTFFIRPKLKSHPSPELGGR